MHRVAIIRSIVLKYGRAGSVARLSESASCFPESTLMVKPCCLAAFTSGSKLEGGGAGCRRSMAQSGNSA